MGNKPGKGNGSSTRPMTSEDSTLHNRILEKPNRQHQLEASVTENEIKDQAGGDGFTDSELATPNSDNVADPIGGLNPSRHTTISFKDLKNPDDDVLTEGGFASISGVEKLKTPRRILGEKFEGARVSKN
ncbi:uncharacterized protein LOC128290532 [Gossypium arboreum]|uniref:uncharacterized protein LOC128290532 n=1 Tax=Gossypium arboreum TaxID=29729 RepID=UPI0022F175EB|nr:uncharacterized protein LOC128290532 [Gossypium arboreum]